MLQPLGHEFGWSTDQLSSVFAVRFALFGLLGPFAAVFIARFGLRRVMVAAAAFIATAMLLATGVTELWQLFVLWGLVLGCGTGLTALVLGAMVANRWFTTRRGLVVGLLAGSTATGQLLFLPLAAWLIEHFGWRYAVIPVFVACIAVALLALLLMRDHPKDIGLRSYGESAEAAAAAPSAPPVPLTFWGRSPSLSTRLAPARSGSWQARSSSAA
jgi:sugar phosphate permease